jgi:FtsP/CotA-like multicopper oxidase with cupredoxin domain
MEKRDALMLDRRSLLRLGGGAVAAAAFALRGTSATAAAALQVMDGLAPCQDGGPLYTEVFPTTPFLLRPFTIDFVNPKPLKPSNPANWTSLGMRNWSRPNPVTGGLQDVDGVVHQVGYEAIPVGSKFIKYPEPLYYRLALQVGQHNFTNSKVQPIQSNGYPTPAGLPGAGKLSLPPSTIYGFSATPEIPNTPHFPGAMVYARYGQPGNMRLENQLDIGGGFDRMDYGSPEWGFLTHLHNGHTACESDGQPNAKPGAYLPGGWCDNLYLNFPAGNDSAEKQSFMWFHDHFMHHTGANVYKGMVCIYPIYDPILDPGDERLGLRLPGVPTDPNGPDGGRTEYDLPFVFYDFRADDGVTGHRDAHNGCGETHPEWWGMHYFRHYPNHGFVGDVFTTNCVAYPVLHVKRRKYRTRFLGASISRIYELSWQTDGKVVPAGLTPDGEAEFLRQCPDGDASNFDFNSVSWDSNPNKRQGQWRYRDGSQCFRPVQIAAEGGLLPYSIVRDKWEIWPAKRRELIVDFSVTSDGQPTYDGQVFYLVNTYQMVNGRKRTEAMITHDENGLLLPAPIPNPDFEPGFCVPMVKVIVDGNDRPEDNSVIPTSLRPNPVIDTRKLKTLPTRTFTLMRSGQMGGETEWLINNLQFEPGADLAFPKRGQPEVWTIRNGGGGWVHPMHFHFEEHRVLSRNGVPTPLDPHHPDDIGREDVIALEPSEEVVMYRNFRTFTGPYVAHCHNLAHEDHNMMFGFKVVP